METRKGELRASFTIFTHCYRNLFCLPLHVFDPSIFIFAFLSFYLYPARLQNSPFCDCLTNNNTYYLFIYLCIF